jgi:hypothetical protein
MAFAPLASQANGGRWRPMAADGGRWRSAAMLLHYFPEVENVLKMNVERSAHMAAPADRWPSLHWQAKLMAAEGGLWRLMAADGDQRRCRGRTEARPGPRGRCGSGLTK